MSQQDHSPLESRVFKFKDPSKKFYCPLCSSERALVGASKLTVKNFFQIGIITFILSALTYRYLDYMTLERTIGFMSFIFFFITWAIFELVVRSNFQKQIPCPYCGFNASWYKRDVKVARALVQEFWDEKQIEKDSKQPHEAVEDDNSF